MLEILYIIAIIVEAMSGAIVAGKKQMDPFGIIIIACSTALGGGTIRDLTLGHYPLTWVGHPKFVVITSLAALVMIVIRPWMRYLSTVFLTLDALGLATFSIIGTSKALELGHTYIISSMMGVFTGVFGGVIRDLLCGEIPLVFRKEIYGSIAFLSAWLYISLSWTHLSHMLCIILTLFISFFIRMFAIRMKLGLPTFNFDETNK